MATFSLLLSGAGDQPEPSRAHLAKAPGLLGKMDMTNTPALLAIKAGRKDRKGQGLHAAEGRGPWSQSTGVSPVSLLLLCPCVSHLPLI